MADTTFLFKFQGDGGGGSTGTAARPGQAAQQARQRYEQQDEPERRPGNRQSSRFATDATHFSEARDILRGLGDIPVFGTLARRAEQIVAGIAALYRALGLNTAAQKSQGVSGAAQRSTVKGYTVRQAKASAQEAADRAPRAKRAAKAGTDIIDGQFRKLPPTGTALALRDRDKIPVVHAHQLHRIPNTGTRAGTGAEPVVAGGAAAESASLAGPLVILGLAAAAAGGALYGLYTRSSRLTKEFNQYEATLAAANARRGVLGLQRDIRSAQFLGPDLAKFTDVMGRIERLGG